MKENLLPTEVQYYLNHISSYDREFAKWEARVTKILKRYRDDTRHVNDAQTRFNILWSNVQTLKAATFARLPKPDVSRRFRDNDPVGRVAALILERALEYEITHYPDYRETLTSSVYDRFLGGRGVSWVRYEPHIRSVGGPVQGELVSEDTDESAAVEKLEYECAPTDYVHWKDFGHNVARTWEEVNIVWRKVYMTREMLRDRFPDEANKIPLDAQPDEMKNASKEGVDKRALIYEIWDKEKNKALWMSKSLGKIIDEKEDPLELEGFYPCPKPLFSTITNESLVPVPDYVLYQDQANALDTLADRIDGLVKALQLKGVYDAATPELARLFTEGSNTDLLPVKNYAAFAEKGGLAGGIDLIEILPIAQALGQAYQAFEQIKGQIYDITGISDIVRGQSVASETATAQQIKGQYASLRLKVYQDEVARFATAMIQLKAQIICKHFSPETIMMMACVDQLKPVDQEMVPQAIELLRDDPMRSFRVEISTDSMIQMDEQQEKQDRMEFLTATSQFLEKAVQASSAAPQLTPLILDLLKFGVTGFRVGKSMEGVIDQTAEEMKQMLAKQQANPQPDPEQMKIQAQQQTEQAKLQIQAQADQLRAKMESEQKAAEMQQQAQLEQLKAQKEAEIEQIKQMAETEREAMRLQFEREKLQAELENKLNVAQISAQATITSQQDKAAEGAVQ